MQRELGRLPGRSHKQQQTGQCQHAVIRHAGQVLKTVANAQVVPAPVPQNQNAEQKADIAKARDEKRLPRRRRGRRFGEPEADQQITAKAHSLPEGVEQDEVVRQYQSRHREQKQADLGEEARIARIVVHVADSVNGDEQTDECNGREHDRCQPVRLQGEADVNASRIEPGKADRRGGRLRLSRHADQGQQREETGSAGPRDARPMAVLLQHAIPQQRDDGAAHQRQDGDQPQKQARNVSDGNAPVITFRPE